MTNIISDIMINDKHISILFNEINIYTTQTRLINIICYILIILGVIGNVLGLFIFSTSRRSWRISSIYVYLATSSSIINLLCVFRYACTLHSKSRNFLHELVGEKWWACKIYEFSFCFRVISSWITLFWMFERLIRVSRQLRTLFNRWNSFKLKFIIPLMIIIIILCWVIGPPVYMFQPQIINDEILIPMTDETKKYCELSPKTSIKWQKYFYEIHFGFNHFTIRCIFSELVPTGAILLFNSYIIYQLIQANYHLHQSNNQNFSKERSRTTQWMNIVLVLHSLLFLASLFSHIIGHFTVAEAHEAWWVLLTILINCSLNFYIYCLSGKAFRNEIHRFIRRIRIQIYYKLQIRQRRQQQQTSQEQNLLYEMNNMEPIGELRPYR